MRKLRNGRCWMVWYGGIVLRGVGGGELYRKLWLTELFSMWPPLGGAPLEFYGKLPHRLDARIPRFTFVVISGSAVPPLSCQVLFLDT